MIAPFKPKANALNSFGNAFNGFKKLKKSKPNSFIAVTGAIKPSIN